MIYLTYNATEQLENSIAGAMTALATLVGISWLIGIIILIATVALITWVVKKVWYAGENRAYKRQQRKYRKQQKEWKKYQKEYAKRDKILIEEEQKQRDYSKNKGFGQNPDWKWDEKTQLWRHRSQWDKLDK